MPTVWSNSEIEVPAAELGAQLVAGIKRLHLSQEYIDVIFRIETDHGIRELGAHRSVLSIRSPKLAEKCSFDSSLRQQVVHSFRGVDFDALESLIEYIYTDNVSFQDTGSLEDKLVFLARLKHLSIQFDLSRLAALTSKEILRVLESSSRTSEAKLWYTSMVKTLNFLDDEIESFGTAYDFGLKNLCLALIADPHLYSDSAQNELLRALAIPLGTLISIKNCTSQFPCFCSAATCVDILRRKYSSNHVIEMAILIGRPDIIEEMLKPRPGYGMQETEGPVNPLELALYLCGKLSTSKNVQEVGGNSLKKLSQFEKYNFSLSWLSYKEVYNIAVTIVVEIGRRNNKGSERMVSDIVSDDDSFTLLGIACAYGHVKHVQTLLQEGVDVNSVYDGNSPLHIAASNCQPGVVSLLLEYGAVPNLQNSEGRTALHLASASKQGFPVVVALLNTDDYSLSKPHSRRPLPNLKIPDKDGWTALHHAAAHGNVDTCKAILGFGRDNSASTRDLLFATEYGHGRTASHMAASHGHVEILGVMLSFERSLQPQNSFKVQEDNVQREQSANNLEHVSPSDTVVPQLVNFGDLAKTTPLHCAAKLASDLLCNIMEEKGDLKFDNACKCIDVLLDFGADALQQSMVGYVALHYLLGGGGSTSVSVNHDHSVRSPLSFLSRQQRRKASGHHPRLEVSGKGASNAADSQLQMDDDSKILRPLTSLLNTKNGGSGIFVIAKDRVSPLHCAVRFKHFHSASLLIRRGADIHARDIFNNSPLSLARELWPFQKLANNMLKLLPAAPSWVDDADTNRCESCTNLFSVTVRRHHCRHCGSIICTECSPHNMALPRFGIAKNVRVCTACFEALSWPSIGVDVGDTLQANNQTPISEESRQLAKKEGNTSRRKGVVSPTKIRHKTKRVTRHDVVMN